VSGSTPLMTNAKSLWRTSGENHSSPLGEKGNVMSSMLHQAAAVPREGSSPSPAAGSDS